MAKNSSAILTSFFKANTGGGPIVITQGISRDLLLIYREVAQEAIDDGISLGANAEFQQTRIAQIDEALSKLP